MKTSELTGAALDWAVAKAWQPVYSDTHLLEHAKDFHPSTNWAQGGPIIEREGLSVVCMSSQHWGAHPSRGDAPFMYGETPLIAAMRCFVASCLGDEVDVPEELK